MDGNVLHYYTAMYASFNICRYNGTWIKYIQKESNIPAFLPPLSQYVTR